MKYVATILAILLPLTALSATPSSSTGAVLPSSLDAVYPPVAPAPLHLFAMLDADRALNGIVVNLLDGDAQNALAAFDRFRAGYAKLSAMVPEWREDYPEAPVNSLGEALRNGDTGRVMQAVGEVGGVCHACHLRSMAAVQLRYRWGDFGGIKVKGSEGDAPLPYPDFKRRLAASLTGVAVNTEEGQPESARRHFQAFRSAFAALRSSCAACHDEGFRGFMDGETAERIERLDAATAGTSPNVPEILKLVSEIGQGSCSKCHLVHVPAAMAAAR